MAPAIDATRSSDDVSFAFDRLLLSLDIGADGWRIGDADVFELVGHSLAQLIWTAAGEGGLRGSARLYLSALKGQFEKYSGLVPHFETAERPVGAVMFVAGNHRVETVAGADMRMPVDGLRLLLHASGIPTAAVHYSGATSRAPLLASDTMKLSWMRRSGRDDAMIDANAWTGYAEALAYARAQSGLPRAVIGTWVQRLVSLSFGLRAPWQRLFERSRPRALVVCGGIDPFTASAVLAARALGVPSYELQHGHLRLFDSRRTGRKAGCSAIADTFLRWTDASPMSSAQACLTIGSPARIFACALDASGGPLKSAGQDIVRRGEALFRDLAHPRVLVTAQPGFDLSQALSAADDFSKGAGTLVLRRHPRLPAIGAVTFPVVDGTDLPLSALLPMVTHHVTFSSATTLEAYDFGVATTLLSDYGKALAPLGRPAESPGAQGLPLTLRDGVLGFIETVRSAP